MTKSFLMFWLTLSLSSALLYQVSALTDPSDVTALKDLFSELNFVQHLAGWNSSGGDPSEESCQSNGLELNECLEHQLFNLVHLKQLNLPKISYSKDLQTSFEKQEEEEQQQQPPQPDQQDLQTSFEKQEEEEQQQQPSQPDQQDQQQPPQPNQEDQQQNGSEVADGGDDGGDDGGGNGEEEEEEADGGDDDEEAGGGNGEEEEEEADGGDDIEEAGGGNGEEEENENEDEENEGEHHGTKEADIFCRPDDPKTYKDDRLLNRNKRKNKHCLRKH